LFCATLVSLPVTASAFEIGTPITNPCHEEITLDAALAAGFPAFSQAPAPTEEQDRAMDDLVFDLPRRDPWSLALFIGVRSNDLEARAPTDLASLIHVHDDPDKQDAHCIRREQDDGAEGDVGALGACRAFILGELEAGGLLEDTIDLTATEPVESYFRFRGDYTIQLPRFAYRLGRAIHAVEDSYAHSMRDPDSGNVRSVLNWIDAFGKPRSYDEARDGYPHLSVLDDCRRTEPVQLARIRHATEAATSIIAAIASDQGNRRQRVEAAVDAALVLIPGCTIANDYCDAPELDEPTDVRSFGCDASGGQASLVVALAVLAAVSRRRGVLAAAFVVIGTTAIASADDAPAPTTTSVGDEVVPAEVKVVPTAPPEHEAPDKDLPAKVQDRSDFLRWHFDARAGASWDKPALAGAVGIGLDYKQWGFGLLGEWNPWMSFDVVGSTRPGVASAYATVAYRWYHSDLISLATRVELGSSMMLFELLGIDKYAVGAYIGFAPTTVKFAVSERMSLTFDPSHLAIPAPRPFGLPFYYKQYRVTVGIEVAL
jgi:uncharacterized protein (TIGR03382 family)